MIIEQFLEEKEIISPKCFYGKREKLIDVCIITFSYIIFSSAKDMEGSKVIASVPSAGGNYEIIKLGVKEKRVGIFLSPVGAPAAGGLMEDINALTHLQERRTSFSSVPVAAWMKRRPRVSI